MMGLGHLTQFVRHSETGRREHGWTADPVCDDDAAFTLVVMRSADFIPPINRDGYSRDQIVRSSREVEKILDGQRGVLLADVTYNSRRVAETVSIMSSALERTASVRTGRPVCLEEIVRGGKPELADMFRECEGNGCNVIVVTHLLVIHMLVREAEGILMPRWDRTALSPVEPVVFRARLRDGDLEALTYDPCPLGSVA